MSRLVAAPSGAPSPVSSRREIARIALPVSTEFLLTLALNFVNQVVVGVLGATAIAAVGFANSLTLILVLTLGGLGTSAAILAARAYGSGRGHELNRVVTAAMLLAGVLGVATAIVPVVMGEQLLRLAGASASVASVGADYFRLASLATVPTLLVAILSAVMRSLGHARSPMVVTVFTAALNVVLGYALVLGIGPFPALGVAGAGLATLVTAVIKLGVIGWQAYGSRRLVGWELPRRGRGWRSVLRSLVVLAVPLGVTSMFWTCGTFLYNVVFQQLGDDALAAAQIVTTLESIFLVVSMGLTISLTSLVGREVGRGDSRAAAAWVRRIHKAGLVSGLVVGLLFASTVFLLDRIFPGAGTDVRTLAVAGILVNAVAQFVKFRNMIFGAGVLPSAGDVRGVILGDVTSAFLVGLPLAVVLGLHTPLGAFGIFVARVVEELAKVAIFSWRGGRVRWDVLVGEQPGTTPTAAEPAHAA